MLKANTNVLKTKTMNKIKSVINIDLSLKRRNLTDEFINIGNEYLNKPMTQALLYEIRCRYRELFNHFELEDLEFRIYTNQSIIILEGIRQIDKFAIEGILKRKQDE